MLGKLDIVQAVVADNPAVVNEKGPHGIALMTHARKGGKEAAEVVKFLQSVAKAGSEETEGESQKGEGKEEGRREEEGVTERKKPRWRSCGWE